MDKNSYPNMNDNFENLNRFERSEVYNASAGSNMPSGEGWDFRISETYRVSMLTWISLVVLLAVPLSNLFVPGDPAEVIRQMAAYPKVFYGFTMFFLWGLFAMVAFTTWRENQSLKSLGFDRFRPLYIFHALAYFMISILILKGLEVILSEFGFLPVGELELLFPKTTVDRILWVALAITTGICEEALYRGYFISRIARLLPQGWSFAARALVGVGLASVAFGLGHTYQGTFGLVMITAYGAMIGGLYLYTRSIWPCVIAHFLLNFMQPFVPMLDGN